MAMMNVIDNKVAQDFSEKSNEAGRYEIKDKWSIGEFDGRLSFDNRDIKRTKNAYWLCVESLVIPELRDKYRDFLEEMNTHIRKIFPQIGNVDVYRYSNYFFVNYNAGYVNKETAEKINKEAKNFIITNFTN